MESPSILDQLSEGAITLTTVGLLAPHLTSENHESLLNAARHKSKRGRCTERGFLEVHHVVPYADGGEMSAVNLMLRCRAHNAYEMNQWSPAWPAQEASEKDHDRVGPAGARIRR